MMTNKQAWQTMGNATGLGKVPARQSNMSVVKGFEKEKQGPSIASIKFVAAKRYSFDDNGGGYKGL